MHNKIQLKLERRLVALKSKKKLQNYLILGNLICKIFYYQNKKKALLKIM